MFETIVKYFFIILCSVYLYTKLLKININKNKVVVSIVFSIISTFVVYFTRVNYYYLTFLIIVFVNVVLFQIIFKNSINTNISFATISVGISYVIYSISSLVISPICYFLFGSYDILILNTITYLLIGIIQVILSYLLFKIKRLKNGLTYFETQISSDNGVFISVFLLMLASLFNSKNNNIIIGTILLFSVLLIGIFLLIWWRKHIKNIYLEKIQNRNIEILENTICEQKEINDKLLLNNDKLSKIIHKDNKMIPAMTLAVEEILNCKSPKEQMEKSQAILGQLQSMSQERSDTLKEYETSNISLPKTGIVSIDASIKYLLNKSKELNISFNFSYVEDIKRIIPSVINEHDFNTLLLDLGENAVIATENMAVREILIVIGLDNQYLCLNIYDSGEPFSPTILANLGLKRTTTHKKTGGSGIGLMNTFELLKKCNASILIDDTISNDNYCKKVAVCFDGHNQYRIHTQRNELFHLLRNRTDVIISN